MEAVEFWQEEQGRAVVTVINLQELTPPVTVHGIRLTVNLKGKALKRACLLPEGTPLAMQERDGAVTVELPPLEIERMVAFEFLRPQSGVRRLRHGAALAARSPMPRPVPGGMCQPQTALAARNTVGRRICGSVADSPLFAEGENIPGGVPTGAAYTASAACAPMTPRLDASRLRHDENYGSSRHRRSAGFLAGGI